MEEDQKALEYQEKMKVDIKNISKKGKLGPIYEFIDTSFFAATKVSARIF